MSLSTASMNTSNASTEPFSDEQLRALGESADATSFVMNGTCLRAFWNKTANGHTAGQPVGTFTVNCGYPADTAAGPPVVVPLVGGIRYVFVAAGGRVWRVPAATGGAPLLLFDARRPGCVNDKIDAQPLAILADYCTSTGCPTESLIVVSTSYTQTCGAGNQWATENRVYAVPASSPTQVMTATWSSSPSLYLGPGAGAYFDYGTVRLWHSFQQPGTNLPSLVQFNVGSVAGGVVPVAMIGATMSPWMIGAGDLRVPPNLYNGRVWVADYNATLRAYNIDSANEDLELPLATGTTLLDPLWIERRQAGGYAGMILTMTRNWYVQAVAVAPTGVGTNLVGEVTWTRKAGQYGTVNAAATPTLEAALGKVFISGIGGVVDQVTASNGYWEADATVGTGTVQQPALDFVGDPATLTYANRLVASAQNGSSATQMRTYCIPWVVGEHLVARSGADEQEAADAPAAEPQTPCGSPADCQSGNQWEDSCTVAACIDGSCSAQSHMNGTPCTANCTGTGVCMAGKCIVDNWDSSAGTCVCDEDTPVGGLGCEGAERCCSIDGCRNLQSDINHCGACGASCGAVWNGDAAGCQNGICQLGPWVTRLQWNPDGRGFVDMCFAEVLDDYTVVTNASCAAQVLTLTPTRLLFGPLRDVGDTGGQVPIDLTGVPGVVVNMHPNAGAPNAWSHDIAIIQTPVALPMGMVMTVKLPLVPTDPNAGLVAVTAGLNWFAPTFTWRDGVTTADDELFVFYPPLSDDPEYVGLSVSPFTAEPVKDMRPGAPLFSADVGGGVPILWGIAGNLNGLLGGSEYLHPFLAMGPYVPWLCSVSLNPSCP